MGGVGRVAWGVACLASSLLALACGARSELDDLQDGEVDSQRPSATCSGDLACVEEGGMPEAAAASADVRADDAMPPDASSILRIAFFGEPGVYDESALMTFLQSYPAIVTRLQTIPSPITADLLGSFDIVILDQLTRTFDPGEAATFVAWLHGGGSVLSLTGYVNTPSDATLPNSLLADLPMRYASAFVGEGAAPIFITDFAVSPVTAGLRQVPFWGGHQVSILGQCDGMTQAVAFLEAAPVGAVCEHGTGRVYLWGDEWVEYTSEWTSATDAQRFWQDAIDWLAVPVGARSGAE